MTSIYKLTNSFKENTRIEMLLHVLRNNLVTASQLFRNLFSLLDRIINVPNHIECTFREI
jgi:hypothetical protein